MPGAARGADAPTRSRESAPVQLAPLRIVGRPVTSFGLSLLILENVKARCVERLFVYAVADRSEAQWKGVAAGDEIVRVDGRPVRLLPAKFDGGSPLHACFVDRRRGDRVTLEILTPGEKTLRRIVLTEGTPAGPAPWAWFGADP